jgi:hypothetical protein
MGLQVTECKCHPGQHLFLSFHPLSSKAGYTPMTFQGVGYYVPRVHFHGRLDYQR